MEYVATARRRIISARYRTWFNTVEQNHFFFLFYITRRTDIRDIKEIDIMKNIPRIFLKEYIVYMLRRVQNKEGRKFRTLRCRRNVCLHCGVLKCGVPVLLESCNSEARAPSDLHSHFAHNVFPRWRRCRRTESGMLAVCTREPACKIRERAKLVASPSLHPLYFVVSPSKDDVFNCTVRFLSGFRVLLSLASKA